MDCTCRAPPTWSLFCPGVLVTVGFAPRIFLVPIRKTLPRLLIFIRLHEGFGVLSRFSGPSLSISLQISLEAPSCLPNLPCACSLCPLEHHSTVCQFPGILGDPGHTRLFGRGVLGTHPLRTAKAAPPSVWGHINFGRIGQHVRPRRKRKLRSTPCPRSTAMINLWSVPWRVSRSLTMKNCSFPWRGSNHTSPSPFARPSTCSTSSLLHPGIVAWE